MDKEIPNKGRLRTFVKKNLRTIVRVITKKIDISHKAVSRHWEVEN